MLKENTKEDLNKLSKQLVEYSAGNKDGKENMSVDVKEKLGKIQDIVEMSSSLLYLVDNYADNNITDEEFLKEWNLLDQQYNLNNREE